VSLIAFLPLELLGERTIWEGAASGISFPLCDVDMEREEGNDCSTRKGRSRLEQQKEI